MGTDTRIILEPRPPTPAFPNEAMSGTSDSSPMKKPYEKPHIAHTQKIETMAAACDSIQLDIGMQCRTESSCDFPFAGS